MRRVSENFFGVYGFRTCLFRSEIFISILNIAEVKPERQQSRRDSRKTVRVRDRWLVGCEKEDNRGPS